MEAFQRLPAFERRSPMAICLGMSLLLTRRPIHCLNLKIDISGILSLDFLVLIGFCLTSPLCCLPFWFGGHQIKSINQVSNLQKKGDNLLAHFNSKCSPSSMIYLDSYFFFFFLYLKAAFGSFAAIVMPFFSSCDLHAGF